MKSGGSRGQEKEFGTQARDIKPETVEFVQGLNYKTRTLEGCLRKYSQKAPCREAITIISPSPSTSSISDFSVSCLDRSAARLFHLAISNFKLLKPNRCSSQHSLQSSHIFHPDQGSKDLLFGLLQGNQRSPHQMFDGMRHPNSHLRS